MGNGRLFLLLSLLLTFLPGLDKQLSKAGGGFLAVPSSIPGVCLQHKCESTNPGQSWHASVNKLSLLSTGSGHLVQAKQAGQAEWHFLLQLLMPSITVPAAWVKELDGCSCISRDVPRLQRDDPFGGSLRTFTVRGDSIPSGGPLRASTVRGYL